MLPRTIPRRMMLRRLDPRLGWAVTIVLGLLPPLAVALLGLDLLRGAGGALTSIAWSELAATDWAPGDGSFGLAPLVLGTLLSSVLALVLTLPVGLAAALYLVLHARPVMRTLIDSALALLGGMPSVVIGLWGMSWIVPLAGNSLAAAALVLALMIAPTFTLLSGAALRQVPAADVEALRALGIGDDAIAFELLHRAVWGLLGAATLAATRGLGEAVALSMVAGNVPLLPSALGEPVATLATTLIIELDGATGLHRSALYLAALLAMALITAVSLAGRRLQRHAVRRQRR